MTPHQIALVRRSFAVLVPQAPQAAALFYANLFSANPALRAMFRGDMAAQGDLLMRMIQRAVGLLDQPSVLLPVLRGLGARHAGFGVRNEHYGAVGRALLRTVGQALGEAFTPDVADAWASMYCLVAQTMQQGAADAVEDRLAAVVV